MNFDVLALSAVLIVSVGSLSIFISHDWRLSIGALGAIYIGVFILTAISWPLEMSVVKLVTGWISASVLGIGLLNSKSSEKSESRYWPSEIVFRISVAGLFLLVAISFAPNFLNWFVDASKEQLYGALILIGIGILHLGLTTKTPQTILGLLVFLAGFEILHASIENSILVAGFLSLVNMGFALIGAYLFISPDMEAEE